MCSDCFINKNKNNSNMFKYRIIIFFVILLFKVVYFKAEEEIKEADYREKRQVNGLPLVYPYGGTYKLLVGFASPVPNDQNINLLFAANFQYQYVQFMNISELSRYYFINEVSREERDADLLARRDERLTFYRSVSNMLQLKGMNGQDCVLRAICEAAQYPVQEEALVGEILHILLTPDYGHSPFENKDEEWDEEMSVYKDAATAGRQMFNCGYIYNGCPEGQGVLDLITTLRDE